MGGLSKLTKSRSWVGEPKGGDLKVMQWNILAQTLAVNGDFPCSLEGLSFNHRFSTIIKEITNEGPDIVCLQEVDFFKDILDKLSKQGYAGIFEKKPNSFCLSFEENQGPDGVAIFYKEGKLSLKSQKRTVLKLSDKTLSNSVLLEANFVHKPSKTLFTVFNTHLKAGSKWSDIRTQQTHSIALELQLSTNYILAGDFNGEAKEEFYQNLRTSDGPHSVFESCLGNEPAYTTWKKRKSNEQVSKKVEDYIFFHPATFSCSSLLNLPSDDSLGSNLLPNCDYPSDHIALVANFTLNTCNTMSDISHESVIKQ